MTDHGGSACDPDRWELTALVLGELGGHERAALLAHLGRCHVCQVEVRSLTAVVDQLTAMVPTASPSTGFVERTLASLAPLPIDAVPVAQGAPDGLPPSDAPGRSPDCRRPPGSRPPHGRPPRRRLFAVVAAAASAAAVVLGVVVDRSAAPAGHRSQPSAVAEMRTATGDGVGQAVVFAQRPTLVSVTLDVPAGTPWATVGPYRVVAIGRDGRSVPLGTVSVARGQGGFEAPVPLAAADIATVRVEGSDGHWLCAGLLPPSGAQAGSDVPPGAPPPGSPVPPSTSTP